MLTFVNAFLSQFHHRQFGITVLTLGVFWYGQNCSFGRQLSQKWSKILTVQWSIFFNWYEEPSKHNLNKKKNCLLRDSLAKAEAECEKQLFLWNHSNASLLCPFSPYILCHNPQNLVRDFQSWWPIISFQNSWMNGLNFPGIFFHLDIEELEHNLFREIRQVSRNLIRHLTSENFKFKVWYIGKVLLGRWKLHKLVF